MQVCVQKRVNLLPPYKENPLPDKSTCPLGRRYARYFLNIIACGVFEFRKSPGFVSNLQTLPESKFKTSNWSNMSYFGTKYSAIDREDSEASDKHQKRQKSKHIKS